MDRAASEAFALDIGLGRSWQARLIQQAKTASAFLSYWKWSLCFRALSANLNRPGTKRSGAILGAVYSRSSRLVMARFLASRLLERITTFITSPMPSMLVIMFEPP